MAPMISLAIHPKNANAKRSDSVPEEEMGSRGIIAIEQSRVLREIIRVNLYRDADGTIHVLIIRLES